MYSEQDGLLTDAAQTAQRSPMLPMRRQERPCIGEHAAHPLITIGIPTRNRSSLLKTCLNDAFAQTYRNIEVLVSDNASTDDTLAVLASIDDSRLRVLSNQEDIGAIGNFAKCIQEARGDYVVLVSDDNFLHPSFLEKCTDLIRQEPGLPVVLAVFDILVLDEFHKNERRVVPGTRSRKLSTGIWHGTEILREYFSGRITAAPLSVVVRTDILQRVHCFSSEYRCAGDLGWLATLLEGRAGLVNEPCAVYFVHNSAISAGIAPDVRLSECCEAMETFSAAAERKISDNTTRNDVLGLIQRYLALQIMITLVLYRRAGASFADVVRKLWTWRAILQRCTWRDFAAILRLRSVARILLPPTVTRWSIALGLDKIV
jgi:glycosyltransferase involved in cell wall biosynthesis